MPIYDYKCRLCGCSFEVRQSYGENSLIRCPKCKSAETHKEISNFSFTFAQPNTPKSAVNPKADDSKGV